MAILLDQQVNCNFHLILNDTPSNDWKTAFENAENLDKKYTNDGIENHWEICRVRKDPRICHFLFCSYIL